MSYYRIFLVGESNPYGSDPRYALYPQPPNAAGGRLARVLGMSDLEYLRAFERRNLLDQPMRGHFAWSAPAARLKANSLLREVDHCDRLVLLGARVAAAFRLDFRSSLCLVEWRMMPTGACRWVLVIPHPSGRSREWIDPGVRAKVRNAVERIRKEEDLDFPRSLDFPWSEDRREAATLEREFLDCDTAREDA